MAIDLSAWRLPEPIVLGATGGGINNRTFFVDAGDSSYFLRIYLNTADPQRVRYEHALLRALREQPLPFGVPRPVPTTAGDTVALLPDGRLAALFERLPGEAPAERGVEYTRACGRALAQLHAALRAIDLPGPPDPVTFGALERIHRLVPDPWSLGEEPVRRILARLRGVIPSLYAELPTQLCHNDYGAGNTLQVDGRLTAVVDFEFAEPDLRAIDLVPGWYFTMIRASDAAEQLARVAAFFEGYREAGELTPAEARAMPDLARLVLATALVHWVGRDRAGTDPEDHCVESATRFVQMEAWLERHGEELIRLTGG